MLQLLLNSLMQTDSTILNRVPLWAIGLVVLLIIIFAVVWTLHEEEETETTTVIPPVAPEIPATTVVETAVSPDDLTIIEGIGPKIASLLQAEGITTFALLAATEVVTLQEIMTKAKLRIANPETWPEQAALAATGNWSALVTLQASLKGGRRA